MKKLIQYTVLLYLILCGAFYLYQHLLYFQPKALDVNHAFSFPVRIRFAEAKIAFDENTVIDVVKFLPDQPLSKGVVLFFHGNRYNVEHYATYAPYFTSRGYECWMPDYPGYGRSKGETNVAVLKQTSLQLHKMAMARVPTDSIFLYGKSLGSGIAAWLASQRDCRLLMLETPYESLGELTRSFLFMLPTPLLLREDIETTQYLSMVQAPTVAWHGTHDELIPLSQAAWVKNALKPGDFFYTIEGANHNGVPGSGVYHASLDSLLGKPLHAQNSPL